MVQGQPGGLAVEQPRGPPRRGELGHRFRRPGREQTRLF